MNQSPDCPSRDREGAVASNPSPPPLSPEQFRKMLAETLANDPELARQLLKPLLGTVIPIVGGLPTCSADYVPKFTNSDCNDPTFENSVIAENSGKIGIGTTSPAEQLHVKDGDLLVENGQIQIRTASENSILAWKDGSTTYWSWQKPSTNAIQLWDHIASSNRLWCTSGSNGSNTYRALGTGSHSFNIDTTTALFIESDGNVGIGTSSPAEKLDVAGNILCQGLNKIVFLKPLGGTQDDQPQIQSAINNLPSDGGIIYLTPGTYRIGSTISVAKNGVKLLGYGGAWRDDGFHIIVSGSGKTVNNTGATPLAKLLWTTSADGPVLELKPSVANTQIQDLELADLSIDGAGVQGSSTSGAKFGLVLNRVTNSRFGRLEVHNIRDATGSVGIKLTTDGTSFAMNTDWNLFDRCTVLLASECVLVTAEPGSTDSNSSHNTFIGLTVSYWSSNAANAGVRLGNCDNNAFYDTFIFQHNLNLDSGLGNGHGVLIDDPLQGRANYFYHLQAVGGFLVKNVNTSNLPANKNMIFGYDQENGGLEPDPTAQNSSGGAVDPELVLVWTDSKVKLRGFASLSTTGGVTAGSGGSQSFNGGSYAIAGTTVIDGSRNITNVGTVSTSGNVTVGSNLSTGGSATIGSGGSQGVNAGSYAIGGTEVISSGKVVKGDVAGVLIRNFNQESRPTLNNDEIAFWYKPSAGKPGLLYNDGTNYFWWRGLASDGSMAMEINP